MEYVYKDILGGVDMDQVLTDWNDPASGFLKQVKLLLPDTKLVSLHQCKEWEASDNYPKKVRHVISSIYERPAPGFFYEMKPIHGAIEAIKRLQDQMEIVIVSTPIFEMDGHQASLSELEDRDKLWCQVVEEKKLWLRKHFGIDAPPLNPLSDKTIFHGDFLIDDKPTAGRTKRRTPSWIHVLYDEGYLYNKGSHHKFRMHWGNWEEVIPLVIEEIQKRRK